MADALRPPTLLLGAVCLWALSLLLLAVVGLGSRFPEATNDIKPPPLPVVSLTRGQSRLGPIGDYLEVGERPLLTVDRRPVAMIAMDGQAGAAELDVVLTGVLITPRLQLAILTNNSTSTSDRVRVGETVRGSNWRLVQLEPRKAVLEGPSGQRVLDLRVFDGKGGEAPTPIVASASPESASPGGDAQGVQPQPQAIAKPSPQSPPMPAKPEVAAQLPAQVSQDQQVEAIRRRIEARRAQMRAEAAATSANEKN